MTNETYQEAKEIKSRIALNDATKLQIDNVKANLEENPATENAEYTFTIANTNGIKIGAMTLPKKHLLAVLDSYKEELQQENEELQLKFDEL